ncbi:uncharacterized protein LOC135496243 [Lineus longissimus]|uniref:uncharacterized protein LOC135496243 n=1 Tax=Lineus longissimus TaxID=88925 RepID=UPI002B4CEA03
MEANEIVMKKFWEDHSKDGSVKEMMLDENAEAFSDLEKAELLSLLPSVTNKDILEIGAGIGRFTGDLAETAKSVLAVDFMENFIQLNKKSHGHKTNTSFLQADVNHLQLPEDSYDIVFSNWLMMYLTNDEVRKLAKNALKWLREDGYFFFRESCFHQSGNKKRGFNPTEYRSPTEYNSLIQSEYVTEGDGSHYQFELMSMQSVKTYIEVKGNCNQICWLMKKVRRDSPPIEDDLAFNRLPILQWMCGENYMVTGGNAITKLLLPYFNIDLNSTLLDYGTGLGGTAFYIAQEFDASIRAIGSRADAITNAVKSANDIKEKRVAFEVQTDSMFAMESNLLDAVICRDYFSQVSAKSELLRIFKNGLKPGKRLVLTDVCRTAESNEGGDVVESMLGPHLITKDRYKEIFSSSGLTLVEALDRTDVYLHHLKQEFNKLMSGIQSFLQQFSMEDYKNMHDEWCKKIELFEGDSLKWVVLVAEKEVEN